MKKIILLISSLFIQFLTIAQEHGEEIGEEYEKSDGWSNDTKWVLVGIFALLIIVLVIRTFRNKPTV